MGASISRRLHDPFRMKRKRPSSTWPLHDRSKKARLEQDPYMSTGHSQYGVPRPLRLGKQIFLSHSGEDKETFVSFLYERLVQRYHDDVAFFDKETLPKAEPVSMTNILEEARRSKLGVLVLTEDFFTCTKNPMQELEAFVDGKVKLLPLFLTMSVDQFKEKERRDGWEKRWREWSDVDEEVIEKWRNALDIVSKFNGMEYCKITPTYSEYVNKVVNEVTNIVRPTISFSEEGVCGKNRLCEMVNSMYKKCASKCGSSVDRMQSTGVASTSASSGLGYTLDVVGIHGFPGLGKTTLCKCLCDFFFAEFNGKVCHVDLAKSPPSHQASCNSQEHSRMLHVLSLLTGIQNFQDIGQVKNLLKMRISALTDPVFLAIDNVLREVESQEEADFYLSCGFPKGSKIFITSKSESILRNLTSQRSLRYSAVIEYMPKLEFEEARDILVHQFPDLHEQGFSNLGNELQKDLNEYVAKCTIHSEGWYHPVMLTSLAAYVKWNRKHNKRDWKERLKWLKSEGRYDNARERVYKLLDNNYELLSKEAKDVFLDIALLSCKSIRRPWQFLQRFWRDEIFSEVQDLGFIDAIRYWGWEIPDLVVDFSKYKVGQQGANPEYAVVDEDQCYSPQYAEVDEDQRNPQYVFKSSVRNVSISRCRKAGSTLDLTHMELRVLHLVDNANLQAVRLSCTACAHLLSLIVMVPAGTSLCFILMDGDSSSTAPSPADNMQVMLHGNISLQSARRGLEITASPLEMDLGSILGRRLGVLALSHMPSVQGIDVTTCVNLKSLDLGKLPELGFVRCLDNSHLNSVQIYACEKLSELTFSADNRNLCLDKFKHLRILACASLRALAIPTSFAAVIIISCSSLERITTTSSYPAAGAEYSSNFAMESRGTLNYLFGEFLDYPGVDPSIFKARVRVFNGSVQAVPVLLADVESLELEDAEHVGLFISALFNARPTALERLRITCSRQGGGCGCDQNLPHFGPLAFQESLSIVNPQFHYHCSQVRDLEGLAQWHVLRFLNLSGCTSVEVWPDFGAMTFLQYVDLSNTSLKEWPAGVQLLPDLKWLNVSECRQLSTQEMTRVLTFEFQSKSGYIAFIAFCLINLSLDFQAGIRDKCFVVDAINALSPELVGRFDQPSSSRGAVLQVLVKSLYEDMVDALSRRFNHIFFRSYDDFERFCGYIERKLDKMWPFEDREGSILLVSRVSRFKDEDEYWEGRFHNCFASTSNYEDMD